MSSKEEILQMWQENHGSLSHEQRAQFLLKCERPELRALLDIPYLAITTALKSKKKLEDVLVEARRIQEERVNHEPKLPEAEQAVPRAFSEQAPVGRQSLGAATSRPEKQKTTQSPPAGNPGAIAPYFSGMVRNQGAPEASTGDRCEHCGAHVPIGGTHDKCRG